MNHHRKVLPAALVAGLGLGTLAVVATTPPAHALTGVFISEIHYDNDGTDTGEFVEVTAPAGTDLSGFSVVLYNGTGGTTYDTDPLSGAVADQQDGWGTFVLDYPTNGIQNGSPDGLALLNGTAVVEFLSYEGTFQATDGPAAGQTSTAMGAQQPSSTPAGQSLQRQTDGTWTGPAANTKGIPNGHTVDGVPLEAQAPADASGYVGVGMDDITLSASGGVAPYRWDVSGLPAGLSESPDGVISGTPTEAGTYEVTVTVSDSATPQGSDTETFTITVREVPTVAIADIQGTGPESPLEGELVTTEGVVTAVYRDPYPVVLGSSGGYDGFYLQTAGTGDASDETPGASDAVFVYTGDNLPTEVAIGDSYRVTGEVDEFAGTTELVPQRSSDLVELTEPLAPVAPLEAAYPTTTAEREAHEGELLAPTDRFTVSNVYRTNQYAEIGLATGDKPLIQPTDAARPGTAEYAAVAADNRARAVTLDDATSVNFLDYGDVEQDIPLPWLSKSNPIRVGAEATLREPVILEFRNSTWKFQPTEPVTGAGAGGDVATFENTREQNQAPQDVGGDIRLATFNVLNYFNTTGEDFEATGADCSYYTDRDDEPVAVNRCRPEGPRGAADAEDFARQQAKIVAAINGLDADIVALEELENSIALGEADRDDAIKALVQALNAAAGPGTWRHVKSPDEAYDPATLAQQDVIRTGFIYRPEAVKPVGSSDILFHPAFAQARQPLAQAFKPVAAPREKFAVVVNHFKSKGCSSATGDNADAGDGQGCFNGDRVRQAQALAGFADEFAAARDVTSVFLTGDFNAYTEEDPMHVLYEAGYGLVESDQEGDWSYSFQGHSGSLDHVLASATALDAVTGADVWEINADEAIAFQYSRYNYNATDFYEPNQFAASDHNPEVVGVEVSALR